MKTDEEKKKLTEEDKKLLLKIAREALTYYLKKHDTPDLSDLGISSVSNVLKEQAATFVTLRKEEDLRGCIGELLASQPLYESVIENAIRAGVHDPRFNPMTLDEVEEVTIKISVLTAPQSVASSKEIRLGTDGVILRKQRRSAVFLPEVATEQGWDLAQTLTHLSMKAGLPHDAWKSGSEFQVFQSIAFGEGENE